jgi:large-conductance mechanosensitive channel
MSANETVMTFAVAIYLGFALSQFFGSITRDLVTPFVAVLFPGVQQAVGQYVLSIGPIKLSIGDAIGATFNLLIAFAVVSLTLPYIRAYVPVGGRK